MTKILLSQRPTSNFSTYPCSGLLPFLSLVFNDNSGLWDVIIVQFAPDFRSVVDHCSQSWERWQGLSYWDHLRPVNWYSQFRPPYRSPNEHVLRFSFNFRSRKDFNICHIRFLLLLDMLSDLQSDLLRVIRNITYLDYLSNNFSILLDARESCNSFCEFPIRRHACIDEPSCRLLLKLFALATHFDVKAVEFKSSALKTYM